MKSWLMVFCKTMTFVLMVFCFKNTYANGDNIQITETKAIELASEEAKNMGYDVKTLQVRATHYKTPSNEYLPANSDSAFIAKKRNKLRNKEYWAIYFVKHSNKKGGDLSIFIDSNTGAVITEIRWK